MNTWTGWVAAALLLGGPASIALAAEAAQTPGVAVEPLSLRQAVVLSLQRHPSLQTFSFALRAQQARTAAAALVPGWQVSADLENVLGTGATSGLHRAEATVSLGQVIELGDKRSRRIELARGGEEQVEIQRAAAQLDVIAEVGRRFIAVARAQQEVELVRRDEQLVRETMEAVRRRVEAARSPDVELSRARVDLLRAGLAVREAASTLESHRHQLAAMWGDPGAGFGSVTADLSTLPRPPAFAQLMERLAATPDFTRFASEARLRDAALRLAESSRRADLQWSAGVRRLQEGRDAALVVGFSMPLHAARRAAPAVAEARALRGQVDADRDLALLQARAQLDALYRALQFAIEEATVLRDEVLPAMRQVLDETGYAYERGRYGYVELVDARRSLLDASRAELEASARARQLHNEIERLAALPLDRDQWEVTR